MVFLEKDREIFIRYVLVIAVVLLIALTLYYNL